MIPYCKIEHSPHFTSGRLSASCSNNNFKYKHSHHSFEKIHKIAEEAFEKRDKAKLQRMVNTLERCSWFLTNIKADYVPAVQQSICSHVQADATCIQYLKDKIALL